MPASFQINEEQYITPTWGNILFSRFLQYLDDIEPQRPECLDKFLMDHYEELATIDEKLSDQENNDLGVLMFKARWSEMPLFDKSLCHVFFSVDVGFWCSIEPELIQEAMNLDQLEGTFWMLQYEMNPANAKANEDFTGFEVEGIEYLLPKKHMTESTVLEFAESAQFQMAMADVNGGNYSAMADVMCVLCRPKDEKYSYSEIKHNRRRNLFLSTTMDNVINTAFFLLRLSDILRDNFLIYTLEEELQRNQ